MVAKRYSSDYSGYIYAQWTISMVSSLRLGVDAGFQRLLNIANVH